MTNKNRIILTIIILTILTLAFSGCSTKNYLKNTTNFGIENAREGYWEEAKFRWEKLLKIDPNDYIAMNNLGVYYESKGKFDIAIQYYSRALEISPKNKYIKINLERARKMKSRFEIDKKMQEVK